MEHKTRAKRMGLREYRLDEMGLANTKATARTLRIAPNWTPEQAAAVYEILDDLIDVIWRQYGPDIQQAFRNEHTYNAKTFSSASIDENDVPSSSARHSPANAKHWAFVLACPSFTHVATSCPFRPRSKLGLDSHLSALFHSRQHWSMTFTRRVSNFVATRKETLSTDWNDPQS